MGRVVCATTSRLVKSDMSGERNKNSMLSEGSLA